MPVILANAKGLNPEVLAYFVHSSKIDISLHNSIPNLFDVGIACLICRMALNLAAFGGTFFDRIYRINRIK